MSTKKVLVFFYFLGSWIINTNVKNECVETRSFLIHENSSKSKQDRNNSEHRFIDIGK